MEDDFSSTTSTSGRVAVGGTASGNIETAHDRDWFAVELVAGKTYRVDLKGSTTGAGTLGDPYLRGIYDTNRTLVRGTINDNADWLLDINSRVIFTASKSGTYYVAAGARGQDEGSCTLSVREIEDDYQATAATTGTTRGTWRSAARPEGLQHPVCRRHRLVRGRATTAG